MNSNTIFFAVCLVFACAIVAQAVPAPAESQAAPAPAESQAQANAVPAEQNQRNKRFFPIAYSAAVSPVITTGYSYLAPYANVGKIVHYPAPAVYAAAYPAAVSTYHIL